jgi:hypothetical protein
VVNQAFVDDPECHNCTDTIPKSASATAHAQMLKSLWSMSRNNLLDRLEPDECLSAYGTMIQSTRRNLLFVTANENVKSTVDPTAIGFPRMPYINNTNWALIRHFDATKGLEQYQDPLDWACTGLTRAASGETRCINRIEEIRSAPQPWTLSIGCVSGTPGYCDGSRWPISYCLSERAELQCQLHFSPVIAIVVTVLNFCKSKRFKVFDVVLQTGMYDGI